VFVLANIVQPLIDVFDRILVAIHSVIPSWGLSIIALTVVVRAALLPLTFKQFRSMQNMQRLGPEIKKMQEKYKDDKQRLNQEMMRFYQENNVNPLSSCLPLVAQFPVFIALFYMLRTDLKKDICPGITQYLVEHPAKTLANTHCQQVDPGSAKFLFIPDLTNKATGAVLVVLIILYIGSQLASTLMMSVTADKTQRRIFMFLPFVFVTFILRFPAGLIVYWITTNTWTIGQQYIVRRTVGPLKAPEPAPAGAGGGLFGSLLRGVNPSGSPPDGGDGKGAAREKQPAGAGAKAEGADSAKDKREGGAKAERGESPKAKGADSGGNGKAGPAAKPPPPPRKKRKQRSGRRR
jgi:YidC/Oxa1 family membrane protein insertase